MNTNHTTLEDRFKAVVVALNQAALKYQVALIDYKTGPEVINSRETYMRHVIEHREIKEKLITYQDYLYTKSLEKNISPKSKSKK
jgi:hypothetical protein